MKQMNAGRNSTVVLGLRTLGGMPNISDETFSQQELVMDINQMFSEVLKIIDVGHFKMELHSGCECVIVLSDSRWA